MSKNVWQINSYCFPVTFSLVTFFLGNCVGGVVGSKLPRFCLFGETINLAARMETYSEPSQIQLSPTTKAILDLTEAGKYVIRPRGNIHIKVISFFLQTIVENCLNFLFCRI